MINKIAMIGLGPMGKNLSLNMLNNDIDVVGFDVSKQAREEAKKEGINTVDSLQKAVDSFDGQKAFWVMVPDTHVDDVLKDLSGHLDENDILIEGGNSFYKDTIERVKWANQRNLFFLGTGVSGGAKGAREGPCIMPGGDRQAYDAVEDILIEIAAEVKGEPCVDYMGPEGAGHFVKMVHNGIEYAIMEAIVESYHIMLKAGFSYGEMQDHFEDWSQTHALGGYLTEITADILDTEDNKTGKTKVETILDTASQKGTGRWASQVARDMGVPVQLIGTAAFERTLSSFKELRGQASELFRQDFPEYEGNKKDVAEQIESGLYTSVIVAYAQGFQMLANCRKTEEENLCGYDLNLKKIAKIWRGGCIIRSKLLNDFMKIFDKQPNLENLILSDKFSTEIKENMPKLRKLVNTSHKLGVPIPVLGDTVSYYDSLRHERLPSAAMIQAMRDYFGSHTYRRVDDLEGIYHTHWNSDRTE
ncbi:MAG: phosphogluconate dehydrogenase (NADP(+)-dependent, decarboxylating), partial [Parcubacteria group bacterium QH_9_35_7]